MSRALVLRRRARRDIIEAANWYDALSPQTGDDFVQEIESLLGAVQNNPDQYQKVRGNVRRALLSRFPYALFYISSDGEIVVMRCLHHRRNPTAWPDDAR